VESEQGKGSVFFFTLPFEKQILPFHSLVISEIRPGKLSGRKILIVEDDDMSYMLINELLSETGARLYRATNGVDAIDTIRNIPEICLVLMDIKLPIMDGIDATREIKKIKPALPVIMQSAYAGREEIENSFIAGSDDYLTKPIDSKLFMRRISELIV
jgi:CheY-like chemotaxis protein